MVFLHMSVVLLYNMFKNIWLVGFFLVLGFLGVVSFFFTEGTIFSGLRLVIFGRLFVTSQ